MLKYGHEVFDDAEFIVRIVFFFYPTGEVGALGVCYNSYSMSSQMLLYCSNVIQWQGEYMLH